MPTLTEGGTETKAAEAYVDEFLPRSLDDKTRREAIRMAIAIANDVWKARDAEVDGLRKDFQDAMEMLHQANAIIMSHKEP
jgi:hypothetical protein